ncbi:MAG: phosphohydrolase [Porphyromonadaceae bacterium]|nr:phosphohydrolase [Porphyromonadaceae bacterium]
MENQSMWVDAAAKIAQQLHEGQRDKAEVDYFQGHLSFVASLGNTWQEKVVGYLHDTSEDTPHTVEEVLDFLEREAGAKMEFSDKEKIEQALKLLNHHLSGDRETYIHNIRNNALARAVKMNDLKHNMDIQRLTNPTEKNYLRLERYKQEYAYLSQIG